MKIDQKYRIGILNGSKSCEPSGFLFNRAVHFLKMNGYSVDFRYPLGCPVILVNTCCVTKAKMLEAQQLIDTALQKKDIEKVVIFGCYAMAFQSKGAGPEPKMVFVGPRELKSLEKFFAFEHPVDSIKNDSVDPRIFVPYQTKITDGEHFVLICQGCKYSCSYCNIKKAKGDVVSRSHDEILRDIQQASEQGRDEIVLLADDCGSYGADIGSDLVELIQKICLRHDDIKLKISNFFPGDFIRLYPRLHCFISKGNISYINVPIQSGSRRILGLMGRKYEVDDVKKIVKEIKSLNPAVWLYTHLLINFPTETMKDYLESLEAAVLFDEFMIITYSDNPLTRASKIGPKVDAREQEKRLGIANRVVSLKKRGIVVENMDVDHYA